MNQKIVKLLLFSSLLFAFSCADTDTYDKDKAVSAFSSANVLKVDPALKNTQVTLPKQKSNSIWFGYRFANNQKIENYQKVFNFKKSKIKLKKDSKIWSFYSGSKNNKSVFSPIINNDKAYFLKPSGVLVAYDLENKKTIFEKRIFPKKLLRNYQNPRISYTNNIIFAIAGINKIVAVNALNGEVIWSKDIASIPISTPIADKESVYVITNDNKTYALNIDNAQLQWVHSGIFRPTAIIGSANPVIDGKQLIVSYSSGEIYSVNKANGESIWSQDLNLNKAINSNFYLNDIDATPIIRKNTIYAIGNGGLIMAIDAKKGEYKWKRKISSISSIWLAGKFLYLIDNNNKLMAIYAKTGGIKWIKQLPDFKKKKKPQTKYIYNGVVMAGNELLISTVDGKLIIASALNGEIKKTIKVDKKISHNPIIINDKIYIQSMGRFLIDLYELK